MKKILMIIFVLLLVGCTENSTDIEIATEKHVSNNEVKVIDVQPITEVEIADEEEQKNYFGEWEVSRIFFSDAPSIWGKSELEEYVGTKLSLTSEKAMFGNIELLKPKYDEGVISPSELSNQLVTTYEALGLDSNNPPVFITIYSEKGMNEEDEWISDSIIYRFFVKDMNTLIAENRNAYLELIRVK